jgi:hypothetical protein
MKILIYIIAVVLLLNISCQRILFNDPEEIREINLNQFHSVIFSGIYNILLVQDTISRLTMKGRNHIGSINVVIKNDTLFIDDNKKLSFNTNRNNLELHFRNLNFMRAYDPVNISNMDTIMTDRLSIETIGEIAEVKMTIKCNSLDVATSSNTLGYQHYYGKADFCYFFTRYGSSFLADSLKCRSAIIYNESVGDVRVNVSDYLKVFIWGNGNVLYRGSPSLEIGSQRGTGKIINI